MYIHEAVTTTKEQGASIRRLSWPKDWYVLPTNGPFHCVVGCKDQAPQKFWNPTADDLLAGDWELVGRQNLT